MRAPVLALSLPELDRLTLIFLQVTRTCLNLWATRTQSRQHPLYCLEAVSGGLTRLALILSKRAVVCKDQTRAYEPYVHMLASQDPGRCAIAILQAVRRIIPISLVPF